MRGVVGLVLLLVLSGCSSAASGPVRASGSASPLLVQSPAGVAPASSPIAFVPDAAGANDYGLNALALNGLRAEAERLGQPAPMVLTAGQPLPGVKLVVGRSPALVDLAKANPSLDVALVDGPAGESLPNLRRTVFDLAAGAREAGAVAAGVSQTGVVAFVGGKQTAAAQQLLEAFQAGAQGARVLAGWAGSDDDQGAAKRVAQGFIARDADVLFAASRPSGLGVIAAASQLRQLAIGIDSDEYAVAPNAILTSVVKRVDVAAASALAAYAEGSFHGGSVRGQVALAPYHALAAPCCLKTKPY